MTMTRQWRATIFVACMALMAAWGTARAQEIPIVTGEHWTKSTEDVKKAYLIGIANMVQIEMAYYAATSPTDAQTFIPRMSRGLKGETLDSVRTGLDSWYARNPDKLSRPVMDIIWFEMVVPGLAKNK